MTLVPSKRRNNSNPVVSWQSELKDQERENEWTGGRPSVRTCVKNACACRLPRFTISIIFCALGLEWDSIARSRNPLNLPRKPCSQRIHFPGIPFLARGRCEAGDRSPKPCAYCDLSPIDRIITCLLTNERVGPRSWSRLNLVVVSPTLKSENHEAVHGFPERERNDRSALKMIPIAPKYGTTT